MEKYNKINITSTSKKQISNKKIFNFYTLKNGSKISCHARPKEIDIKILKEEYKVNYILTIQDKNENPELIKMYTEEIKGITWDNLPLKAANIGVFINKEIRKLIIDTIIKILNLMKKNKLVLFIHCAAGIQRTGTILYTILRLCNESKESIMEIIKFIRIEIYEKFGDDRINYAEEFLVKPLFMILNHNNNEE